MPKKAAGVTPDRATKRAVEMLDFVRSKINAAKVGGKSLRELARQSGVPVSTLSRFVSGETNLNSEHLAKLCDALGLELVESKTGAKKR